MYRLLIMVLTMALAALTQTRVDIQRQAKGVEFLSPPFDRPVKSGEALPLSCAVNDLFLLTTAAPGANLHVCFAEGQWASQGSAGLANVTVLADGELAGTTTTLNLIPTEALSQIISVLPGQLNIQQSVNTAVLMTNERAQSGENLICMSNGGSGTAYSCQMLPQLEALTTGMVVHWRPDVTNTNTAVTLAIDVLGNVPVRLADGVAAPRVGELLAGAMYPLWYDGTVFRVFQPPMVEDFLTVDESQAGSHLVCTSPVGTGNAYSCPLTPPPSVYSEGMRIYWRPSVNSVGGETTFAVNALGTRPVKLADGVTNPRVDELQAGQMYLVWYDGAVFRVSQPPPIEDYLTVNESQAGSHLVCTSPVGTGNAYSCPLTPPPSVYSEGMRIYWRPSVNSVGGETTLAVNALGTRPVKLADGITNPGVDELQAGQLYLVWYDGVQFRVLDFLPQRVALRSELQSSARLRCTSSGTFAQDFTCQMSPALASYSAGLVVHWIPDVTADGSAVTLNVDALGPIAVKRSDGTDTRAEDFASGTLQPLWFDGVHFRMVLSRPSVGEGLRPTCDAAVRGRWWFVSGGTGVADTMAVCAKDDLDAYSWREIYP